MRCITRSICAPRLSSIPRENQEQTFVCTPAMPSRLNLRNVLKANPFKGVSLPGIIGCGCEGVGPIMLVAEGVHHMDSRCGEVHRQGLCIPRRDGVPRGYRADAGFSVPWCKVSDCRDPDEHSGKCHNCNRLVSRDKGNSFLCKNLAVLIIPEQVYALPNYCSGELHICSINT